MNRVKQDRLYQSDFDRVMLEREAIESNKIEEQCNLYREREND